MPDVSLITALYKSENFLQDTGDIALFCYKRFQWDRNLPPFFQRILPGLAKYNLMYNADWEFHYGNR